MKILKIVILTTALVLSTSANAALIGRLAATEGGTDYQAYYDDVANLTWLADANYALTSGYVDANGDGRMTWDDANAWAVGLSVSGVDGWRLADTLQPDASCSSQNVGVYSLGDNCTGSKMGNLFYNVLGNTDFLSDTGPFSNIQTNYWSATEYAPSSDIRAWNFDMSTGYQGAAYKTSSYFAWAVQSGDISAVPIPAAVWLFGSGFIGLIGIARRKKS